MTHSPPTNTSGSEDRGGHTIPLVERLRACANGLSGLKTNSGDYGLCDDAANAIETLFSTLEWIATTNFDHGVIPATEQENNYGISIAAIQQDALAAISRATGSPS